MITLRCCVIDDEPLAGQLIASYIDKTPFLELVGVFTSAQDAIKTIFEEKIDVFLKSADNFSSVRFSPCL